MNTAITCPAWCAGDHPAGEQHERIIGRIRCNRPQTADLVGVRIRQSPHHPRAAIGIHYHRDDLAPDAPRLMCVSLRDAGVLAGALEVLGEHRAARLIRRAVEAATIPEEARR